MKFISFGALLLSLFLVTGCGSKNVDSSGSTSKSTTEKEKEKQDTPQETTIKDGEFKVDGELDVNGKAPSGGKADGSGADSSADSNADSSGDSNAETSTESSADSNATADSNTESSGDSSTDSSATTESSTDNSDEMATAPTDEDGIALDSLATIYFNFDKYDIRDDMKDYVKGNAKLIKDKSIKSIILQGNTDEFGSDEYNMALGQKRALAVRDALVMQGLPKNMFRTISYGTHKPVCKDKTPECYAKNRRTDIVEAK